MFTNINEFVVNLKFIDNSDQFIVVNLIR